MFVVLLNVVVAAIVVGIALLLTLIAIVLIIVSLVRAHNAKKKNKKTAKVGLWIGIAMLVIPWIFTGWFLMQVKISDEKNHRLDVSRERFALALTDSDRSDLYDLMAEDVIDSEDITEEELDSFMDACNITNDSEMDIERYSDFSYSPDYNHLRQYSTEQNGRRQTCFQYHMYDINDDGGELYITGVDGDPEGEEYVGIYLIRYTQGDEVTSIGIDPPSEH